MSINPSDSLMEPERHGHLNSFRSVLGFLVGQVLTVVDSHSVQDAEVGRYVDTEFYEAKVLSAGDDLLLLVRNFRHKHGSSPDEKIRLFLPIDQIKRITWMKEERLIHI
jgi:hypothetical protein